MELFHIHTHRCMHASNETDEEYILKAIQMGSSDIYFTDHAPFPDDPFGNRMKIKQLDEYISSLDALKHSYNRDIKIHIGLEIEYLPSFLSFYEDLSNIQEMDILMIGQHFCEMGRHKYSFSVNQTPLKYAKDIASSIVEGIHTGLFSHVAHPDRMFRYCSQWSLEMDDMASSVICAASLKNVTLEKNLSSMQKKSCYWPQFWKNVSDTVNTTYGLDAHSITELDRIYDIL